MAGNVAEADHGRDNGPRRQTLRQCLGDVGWTSDRFQNDIGIWKAEISLFGITLASSERTVGDVETTFDRRRFGINMLSSSLRGGADVELMLAG